MTPNPHTTHAVNVPPLVITPATPNADLRVLSRMPPGTPPQPYQHSYKKVHPLGSRAEMEDFEKILYEKLIASRQTGNDTTQSPHLHHAQTQLQHPFHQNSQALQQNMIPHDRLQPTQQQEAQISEQTMVLTGHPQLIQVQPQKRQSSRTAILNDSPAHNYTMPTGRPLNFTIVEINVFLPRWFQNFDMAVRFHNNLITGKTHVNMMTEHRNDIDSSTYEVEKMSNQVTSRYRTTMRRVNPAWTKTAHYAPNGWDTSFMAVNHFVPDAAREFGFGVPQPVPFTYLLRNIKKMPTGDDAGDLTRAITYALQHQKTNPVGMPTNFLFPDDLHIILQHIGYTHITEDHGDRAAIKRYTTPSQNHTYNQRIAALAAQTPMTSIYSSAKGQQGPIPQTPFGILRAEKVPQPPQNYAHNGFTTSFPHSNNVQQTTANAQDMSHNGDTMQHMGSTNLSRASSQTPNIGNSPHENNPDDSPFENNNNNNNTTNLNTTDLTEPPNFSTQSPNPPTNMLPREDTSTTEWYLANSFDPGLIPIMQEMDALLEVNQKIDYSALLTTPPPSSPPPPGVRYLADCEEADDEINMSDLARAARWCREPVNRASNFTEENLGLVLGLM